MVLANGTQCPQIVTVFFLPAVAVSVQPAFFSAFSGNYSGSAKARHFATSVRKPNTCAMPASVAILQQQDEGEPVAGRGDIIRA
jgi:hypothetical protein